MAAGPLLVSEPLQRYRALGLAGDPVWRAAGQLRALDMRGLAVGEAPFDFGASRETKARFELPIELRNEIARVEIAEERSAGAVTLLDERWKRRRVGVLSGRKSAITSSRLAAPGNALSLSASAPSLRYCMGCPV